MTIAIYVFLITIIILGIVVRYVFLQNRSRLVIIVFPQFFILGVLGMFFAQKIWHIELGMVKPLFFIISGILYFLWLTEEVWKTVLNSREQSD